MFLLRYWRIVSFFGWLVFKIIFNDFFLKWIGLGSIPRKSRQKRFTSYARAFRTTALKMGGVLIKVGQFLSSRIDVLPDYVVKELSNLQDEVPPEKLDKIINVVEAEFGKGIGIVFKEFAPMPVAAASLGQVHSAVLFSGEKVVVKVQRCQIEKIVATDLKALRTVVRWLRHWHTISDRVDVIELFNEFSAVLLDELDYGKEATNARRFAEMFADDSGIRVPKVYPDYSTRRALTLEDVQYIKITDYARIDAAGIDRKEVATRLMNTYLRQIFVESFFHADPHPGNLFVEPAREGHDWRLVFVDFGMVGKITPVIRQAIREMIISLVAKDSKRMVQSFVDIGAILPGADLDRLTEAINTLFQHYWGKSMDELRNIGPEEMGKLIYEFRDVLYEMPFQMPENLIYLGRCVAILSGICTGLYPEFNLFYELIPFGEKLLSEEMKGKGIEYWLNQGVDFGRMIVGMPGKADRLLDELAFGKLAIITKPDKQMLKQFQLLNRTLGGLVGAFCMVGFLFTSAYLFIHHNAILAYIGWGIAFLICGWLVFRRKK